MITSAGSSQLLEIFQSRQHDILEWLHAHEETSRLPLYSSVDVRDGGFKSAVVDTNIFPGGFNNLCPHGHEDAAILLRLAINRRVPGAKRILIVIEEHTRNVWYLESVRILEEIVRAAGFETVIATFLTVEPDFCQKTQFVSMMTSEDKPVHIYCLKHVLEKIESGAQHFDLVLLNNDLSGGLPESLKRFPVPVYPSMLAGWHSRSKAQHFGYANTLLTDLAKKIGIDPWLFSADFCSVDNVSIHEPKDRSIIEDAASDLLKNIQRKYAQHGISEKPYIVLKADSGTYGMGVMAFDDPKQLVDLNRKNRNKLARGKGSTDIRRYILQEGIPTVQEVDGKVSEVVMYQIENHLIGGFFRSHAGKGQRDNLNSKGMMFKKICPHLEEFKEIDECQDSRPPAMFDVYRVLARIAGIAACREIQQLEERR